MSSELCDPSLSERLALLKRTNIMLINKALSHEVLLETYFQRLRFPLSEASAHMLVVVSGHKITRKCGLFNVPFFPREDNGGFLRDRHSPVSTFYHLFFISKAIKSTGLT